MPPRTTTIRIDTLTTHAGECPLCGFDSLHRVTGLHLTQRGVTTLFDIAHCGRCIDTLRDAL